jgi:DNA-binding response OmpR family regulator
MRLLVLDAHGDTARLLARVLSRAGYDVLTAATADQTRRLCRGGGVDLLIAEPFLPGDDDGWALMAELARECGQRGIALSAHAYESDRTRSLAAGFAAHLNKPVSLDELLAAVRAASKPPKVTAPSVGANGAAGRRPKQRKSS